jgi:hypothetical protein
MMAALPSGLRSLCVLLCVATVMCVAAPSSQAQESSPVTAAELYQKGLEAYKAQRYEIAADLLAQSFERESEPQVLFAWAQSERFLNHCEKAAALFDRFIAMAQTEQQTAAAELAKRRCVEAPGAPTVTPSRAMPAPETAPAPMRPVWYRDVLAGSLCAAGVVAIGSGVGLMVSAQGLAGDAQSAETLGASQALRLQAERRWNWGMGVSLAGAVLFSGGIARYVWFSHTEKNPLVTTGGTF